MIQPSASSSNAPCPPSGLVGGEIAGVAIGSILGALLIGALLMWRFRTEKRLTDRGTPMSHNYNIEPNRLLGAEPEPKWSNTKAQLE